MFLDTTGVTEEGYIANRVKHCETSGLISEQLAWTILFDERQFMPELDDAMDGLCERHKYENDSRDTDQALLDQFAEWAYSMLPDDIYRISA